MRPDLAPFLNDRLDWNLLRTYLVIIQERSVSRAAARLHVTQPAVSQPCGGSRTRSNAS